MMNGRGEDLRQRTKEFALRIIRLCSTLARTGPADVIGRQLVRCGTSVGAQYREACRARSAAEFISKVESAAQELMRRFIGSNSSQILEPYQLTSWRI